MSYEWNNSHSKPIALSLTQGGRTSMLEALVRPLTSHSSISAGASTAATFAASINGSLIMLTVNSFVARMFSLVSLGFRGDKEKEILNNGGLCATMEK